MPSYAPGGLRSSITTTGGATVRPNKIKQMWRAGQYVTMGWLSISHGFTAEVMARQGFDTLCIDMQHGTTEMNDVWPMLQAISQTDTVPVVRVPWNDPATIMKALGLGAYGIIVPLINSAEDAAKAVAACRYPPVGMRSSGPVRAVHYGGADYLAKANDEIVDGDDRDRKSTRLNSSHSQISYAVFCLKKKKNNNYPDVALGYSIPICISGLQPF